MFVDFWKEVEAGSMWLKKYRLETVEGRFPEELGSVTV